MGYAFRKSHNVAGQVRDIAAEQVDKALETVRGGDDFDSKVHALRRICKKLRALLKLVRPGFSGYADENAAIRAIAEQFSVARDAAVMVETLSGLLSSDAQEAEQQMLKRLEARATHLRQQVGETALLANADAQLEALRQRVDTWRFSASGNDIVFPGFKAGYARFREDFGAAQGDPDGEVMHDWRKATKAHWYHVRLFENAAPGVLGGLATQLDQLGETLGDHHNLAVLTDWIDTAAPAGGEDFVHLRNAIAERQAALASESFAMAGQFVVEKPGALTERFRHYWTLMG